MRARWYSALLVVLLTYINGPFFFVGITPLHRLFYYGMSVLPMLLAVRFGFKADSDTRAFLLHFLFLLCCILLVPLVTFAFDFAYLFAFARSLLNIFGTLSVFAIHRRMLSSGKVRIGYRELALDSAVLYVTGTVVFLCFPSLRLFWSSILTDFQTADFTSVVEYITRFGFAGFSGFGFTFWMTSCTVIFCYMYVNRELKESKARLYVVFLLMGSFFYGRTGFVVCVCFFGLLVIHALCHRRIKLLRFFILIIAFFTALGFVLYLFVPAMQPFIDWLLEPVFNYLSSGNAESASTNGLRRFYQNFHPSDRTLLLGDGYWMDLSGNGYYGHTDVGFMRNIYYGGIFYMAAQYSLVLAMILFTALWMKRMHKVGLLFIPFLMLADFALFELKGDAAFMFIKQYLPLYLSFLYEDKGGMPVCRRFL